MRTATAGRIARRQRRVFAAAVAACAVVAALLPAAGCNKSKHTADSGSGTGQPSIALHRVAGGMRSPTHLAHAGDGSGRLFVTEQRGRIIILKGNDVLPRPFLDISDRVGCCGERGLLSVAFPPGFAAERRFYVAYTDRAGTSVVSRFGTSADRDIADPESEEILLTVEQPYANHNGGQLAFGPDGYLYIGLGDGGAADDPHGNGQNRAVLLGKLLRIDVSSNVAPYVIPADNPFRNVPGFRAEIWALGLRNPWRFSFDRLTGDLYVADVGQNRYEEINVQPAASPGGENYGWNIMEGTHCFPSAPCDQQGLVVPVAEYDHSAGCSVTGGMVYRGEDAPALRGMYFYGDFCSGRIWALTRSDGAWQALLVADTDLSISTFGEDERGEIHVADYASGTIYRIAQDDGAGQ